MCLLLLGLLSIHPAPAAAQTVIIYAEGGVNLATLTVDPPSVTGFKWLTGVSAGGLVLIKAAGVPLQIEGLVSVKGTRIDLTPSVKLELTYLDVPVTARMDLRRLHLPVHGFAGVTFGVLLSAKSKDGRDTTDIDDAFEKSDVGLTGGVAYQSGRLIVTGRFTEGLRDVDVGADKVRNRSFAVMAGWKLR